MIELSKHIESLLLKHNCVIVPGLGGFVTQYVPARRVEEEQLFLPPYRSVGFNAQLNINDGLLVQSYMQTYDTTYPETIKLINDAVRRIKEELQQKGAYALHGIGTISVGHTGSYEFTPCEAGVPSPELYGFDSFMLKERPSAAASARTPAERPTDETPVKRKKQLVKRTQKDFVISINRELVNYVAAAVVAMVFYFVWATPVVQPAAEGDAMSASMLNEQLFSTPRKQQPQRIEAQPAQTAGAPAAEQAVQADGLPARLEQTASATPAAAAQAAPAALSAATAQPAATAAPDEAAARYTIVLVSAVPRKNAERFAEEMKAKGHADTSIFIRGKMTRVVTGRYASEAEAATALRRLRADDAFADAWVMAL